MLQHLDDDNTILLIRHGHRPPIPRGCLGNDIKLSKEGREAAYVLGQKLKHIKWRNIQTSPVERCVETADYILKGLGQKIKINRSSVLGDPGPFIVDPIKAAPIFLETPLNNIMHNILSSRTPLGVRSLHEGSELFLSYLHTMHKLPCLMISHDSIIALLYAYFFKTMNINEYIPDFLEGLVITKKSDGVVIQNQEKSVFYPQKI